MGKSFVFTFPRLCINGSENEPDCEFVSWSKAHLAIDLQRQKFIVAENVKIVHFTQFHFAGFEESAEPSLIKITTGKELKAKDDTGTKYASLLDSAWGINNFEEQRLSRILGQNKH